ncbi:MAG: hypothetical protein KIT45_02605 [Fimbriimonadia bacterium]|nr:hypothetical protein [Fimbriimonadia bacterium]
MTTNAKPLAELTREAIQILYREMGIVNTVRVLKQFTVGFGDYTQEREALFENQTMDTLIDEIKQHKKGNEDAK